MQKEKLFEEEIFCKLCEAEQEAEQTQERYSSEQIFKAIKNVISK